MKHHAYSCLILWALLPPLLVGQTSNSEQAPNLDPVIEAFDPWLDPPQQQTDVPQAPSATPASEWTFHKTADGIHPDANEQQMMWLMNRARTNPEREGIWLAGITQGNVANAVRYFKVDLDILRAEFAARTETPPAAFDNRIYQGSVDHSDDLINRDAQDHNGQFDKIRAYFSFNGGSASVYSYSKDAIHAHAGFNIDWGGNDGTGMQSGRGHRQALMGSRTNAGIAMVPDNDNSNKVGPLVTSIGYVNARTSSTNHYNRFIVGTVWTDSNGNDQYDAGEGHGGVSVIPDRGDFYATTGNEGGFSIPATETGIYTITVSGGDISTPEQRIVNVGSESVLMIWNQADTWDDPVNNTVPEAPKVRVEVINGQTRMTWEEIDGLNYQLRQSTNLVTWQNDNRSILTDGPSRYFALTQSDIAQRRFFDLLVTPE